MAKRKLALGLDIGSSSVKLIHLKEVRRRGTLGYQLQSFGTKALPPEAIVDGALMNSTAIVQAIQELVAELKVRHKDVAIGVSGHSVIIKKISLPRMSQEELDESIQWEAEQYIPFDIKDVNIDTFPLPTGNDQTGQMDVLLVAAKKDMINDYTSVVAEAGLSPAVVDVDAFAVQNCYETNYEMPTGETIVLINAGASVVNINIIANGVTTFTRDVTIGGNQFTEEIQRQMNVSFKEAEALKTGRAKGDAKGLAGVVDGVSANLCMDVKRSLDFFLGGGQTLNVNKIYLSGGGSKTRGLKDMMQEKISIPVEPINPFKNLEHSDKAFDEEMLADLAPYFAVGVGLATRKFGDR